MLRRFLQKLQEAVEGRRGKHVDFVDDIYLSPAFGGIVYGLLLEVAHVVDAVVGGSVHLDHVEIVAVLDGAARRTDAAGIPVFLVPAVDRLGKDAGTGGFAGTARSREKIGVGEPFLRRLVHQDVDDLLLSHHVPEMGRTPFQIQSLTHILSTHPPSGNKSSVQKTKGSGLLRAPAGRL